MPKRPFILISATIFAGAMALPALGQTMSGVPLIGEHAERHPNVEFDKFLDNHPKVARQLRHDPRLIDDPRYLAAHPELASYLQRHPHVAQLFRAHPD